MFHQCAFFTAPRQSGRPYILPMNFLSFFLSCFINTSSGCGQMYAKWIGMEILPTPPLISPGQKVRNWHSLQHHSTLTRPHLKMQQDIKVQCCDDRRMSSRSLMKLGPRSPLVTCTPHHNIARQKHTKESITPPWIIPFHSNFVQSLNA